MWRGRFNRSSSASTPTCRHSTPRSEALASSCSASRTTATARRSWRKPRSSNTSTETSASTFSRSRPLVVTGIDPRHTGAYAKVEVAQALEERLGDRAIATDPDWPRFRELLVDLLEKEYGHRVDASDRAHFMEVRTRLREQLRGDDDETEFWRQELTNLAWTARNAWGMEGRDEGMGRNLVWLANQRFPHEGIVVWAHNFHIVRSAATLDANHPAYARQREKHPDTPLGEIAARELGTAVRSIAFVAGQGWYSPHAWSGDTTSRAEIGPPLLAGRAAGPPAT